MPRKKTNKKPPPAGEDNPPPRSPILFIRTRKLRLSSRQVLILAMMAQGSTMKEVAHKLKLNHATIRTHVRRAQRRLQARTRDQMFAMAGAAGLWKEDGIYIETL